MRGVVGIAVKKPISRRPVKSAAMVKTSIVTALDVAVERNAECDTNRVSLSASPPSACPPSPLSPCPANPELTFASSVEELNLGPTDVAIYYGFDGGRYAKVKYVGVNALYFGTKTPEGYLDGDKIYVESAEGRTMCLLKWIRSKRPKYKAWRKHTSWCKANGSLHPLCTKADIVRLILKCRTENDAPLADRAEVLEKLTLNLL